MSLIPLYFVTKIYLLIFFSSFTDENKISTMKLVHKKMSWIHKTRKYSVIYYSIVGVVCISQVKLIEKKRKKKEKVIQFKSIKNKILKWIKPLRDPLFKHFASMILLAASIVTGMRIREENIYLVTILHQGV